MHMKKIYIAIGVILLVLLALGCSGNNSSSDNTQTSGADEQTAQVNTQENQTPEQTAEQTEEQNQDQNEEQTTQEQSEPEVIASWEGESIQDTDTFTVPTEKWKIIWDTQAGKYGDMNFQIYVYDEKTEMLKSVAANVIGTNNGSTVMRGSGDYYLKINAAQPYKITVETA